MRLNIPTKVMLVVEILILVMFGPTAYVIIQEFRENSLELIESRSDALAQTILIQIQKMYANVPVDQSTLKQFSEELSSECQRLYDLNKEKNIVHIAMIDSNGNIFAHNDTTVIGNVIKSQKILRELEWCKTITVLDETIYHTLVPVMNTEGDFLSAIDIGYPKEVHDTFVKQSLMKIFSVFVVFFIITSPIVLVSVYLMVTKPIKYLVQVGNQMTQGHFIDSIQFTNRGDERALLGTVFVNLSKYFQEVTELATQIASGSLEQQHVERRSKRDMLGYALQEMLSYLQTVATETTRIAKGDLSITIPLRSDKDAFGRALQHMMDYLREMADAATTISTGDLRGQITPRSEHDVLGNAFHRMTAYLNRIATAATEIAAGDLQQDVQPETEHDVLGNAFHTMAVQLRENFEKIQQEVAERTRAQEALQKLNEELEQRVEARTLELQVAYEEIRILNDQFKEENVRMSAELDIVRRLQEMILPSPEELQQIKGLDIVGYMKPANEVGGDYYDVLKKNGTLHIGIGDVTGHGLESGVLMLMTQTVIRTLIEHGETDPKAFLTTLNRTIYKNIHRMGSDKTLTFALVNYQDGQLKVVGQHEEILVVRKGGKVERMDTMNLGFPIGLEEEIAEWVAEVMVSLQPGDGVVLYTDGITEAEDMQEKLFGLERLCEVVGQHWDKSVEDIKQEVVNDVTRYIGKQMMYDDMTLVVLKQT